MSNRFNNVHEKILQLQQEEKLIHDRLLEIVVKLMKERDVLKQKLQSVRPDLLSDAGASSLVAVTDEKKDSLGEWFDMLKDLPERLLDAEMLKLATYSKLRDEIAKRQEEEGVPASEEAFDQVPYLKVLGGGFKRKGATIIEFRG